MARNSAPSSIEETGSIHKGENEEQDRVNWVAGRDDHEGRGHGKWPENM